MSQKNGKLLKRYASQSKQNLKDIKRWWAGLPWNQRAKQRAAIKVAMQVKQQ